MDNVDASEHYSRETDGITTIHIDVFHIKCQELTNSRALAIFPHHNPRHKSNSMGLPRGYLTPVPRHFRLARLHQRPSRLQPSQQGRGNSQPC